MELFTLSVSPDTRLALIVIVAAFGVGLAGGIIGYFKIIRNKK